MLVKKSLHELKSAEWLDFCQSFEIDPALYNKENIFYSMWKNNLSSRVLKKIGKDYKLNLFEDTCETLSKIQDSILNWNNKNWRNHHEMLSQCIPLCNQNQLEQLKNSMNLAKTSPSNNKKRKFISEDIENKKPIQNMESEKQSIWNLCCSFLCSRINEKKVKERCNQFLEEKDLAKAYLSIEQVIEDLSTTVSQSNKENNKITSKNNKRNKENSISNIKMKCFEVIKHICKTTPTSINILCKMNNLHKDTLKVMPIVSIMECISSDFYNNYYFCMDWNMSPVEKHPKHSVERYFSDKKNIYAFLSDYGFSRLNVPQIDGIKLKKGFVGCVEYNKKKYIIKYQPMKSYNELLINNYVKKCCKEDPLFTSLFVFPEFVFLLSDFSYFMITPKFHCNLNNYFALLEKKNKPFQFKNMTKVLSTIVETIIFLKSIKIVHADLKLDNVVLNIDNDFNIIEARVIDFDVSLFLPVPEEIKSSKHYFLFSKVLDSQRVRGTRLYVYNEKKTMTFEHDVYSFGVLCLMIFYKIVKLYYKGILNNKDQNIDSPIVYDEIKKKINILDELKKKSDQQHERYLFIKTLYDEINSCLPSDFSFHLECYKKMIDDCLTANYTIQDIYLKYAFVIGK